MVVRGSHFGSLQTFRGDPNQSFGERLDGKIGRGVWKRNLEEKCGTRVEKISSQENSDPILGFRHLGNVWMGKSKEGRAQELCKKSMKRELRKHLREKVAREFGTEVRKHNSEE